MFSHLTLGESMTISAPVQHVERAVSDPVTALPPTSRRRNASFDEGLMGVALLAGPANVIMQLARPGVGYGVVESRVESGRVDRHPIKRARTTFTYLAVATKGSPEQKAAFRRAVNRAHAQVYSTDESPVSYHAFDRDLRLWVGEMDEETAERHYREGVPLGTTLQVPDDMWPEDRGAFDRYWQESLENVHIDDTVREYLWPLAAGRVRGVKLPAREQRGLANFGLLFTTCFLPQRFRDEIKLESNAAKQRRFDRTIHVLRFINDLMPRFVRQFPFNVLLKDVDWRIKTGRPLV